MTAWTGRTTEAFPTPWRKHAMLLIEPLRNVYGVSDKVLAMALSGILMGAADGRPQWLEVGANKIIAIETLVHNFLHRTGMLNRLKAAHSYGPDLLPAWRLRRYYSLGGP